MSKPARVADVVVVGGGPAGAAAAITLARAGRSVVLLDKARFQRDKCCGDGLTTGALRRLDALGLDPSAVPSWQPVDDVHVRSTSGREVRYPLPRGQGLFAAVATRMDLDAALLDVARAAGVDVLDGHAAVAAEQDGDTITVDGDGIGGVVARYAVGADGMWSPLRKLLGGVAAAPPYLGEWHAYRQYYSQVATPASRELWVWFEPDLLPGYAWSFPLPGGRVNLGFGIERRAGVATKVMKALWAELLERPHIAALLGPSAVAEEAPKAWPIPAAIDHATLAHGRAVFVGDAARACDVLTGEGIGQALQTGTAAADAILAAGALAPSAAARQYEATVARDLVPDHRMSWLLQHAMRYDAVCRGAARVSGANEWTRANFGRWLFEDYPRGIMLTPGRWRRGVLAGPGAFRD